MSPTGAVADKVPVGVLASGSGTNLQALLDVCAAPDFPARIAVVISNRKHAAALDRARSAGVPAVHIPRRRSEARELHDAAMVAVLHEHQVEWVCLAGYMLFVTDTFLAAFPQRVINVHPALLPAFVGLNGQGQAHDHGVRIAGATVHFVDGGCDTGPIISQGAVPVLPDDDPESLRQRILTVEHQLYPQALHWAVEGRLHIDGRKVHVDLKPGEQTWLFQPS